MLEFAIANSKQAHLGRQIAEYTDAQFETANLILAALLRPYEAQDLTSVVFSRALDTAMFLSRQIAEVYKRKIDARLRPTCSRVAASVSSTDESI